MSRRFFPALLLGAVTTFTLAGIHSHLRAQEAKPALKDTLIVSKSVAASGFDRPNLREWLFPGMMPKNDHSFPNVAILTGVAGPNYAAVFDYYAKKIGAANYDLKEMTTLQAPNHELLTSVHADFDASGNIYVDSQTMQATFCQRTEHESVSIFITKSKQSNVTFISLTSTRR